MILHESSSSSELSAVSESDRGIVLDDGENMDGVGDEDDDEVGDDDVGDDEVDGVEERDCER